MPNQRLSFTVEEVNELLLLINASRTVLDALPPVSESEMFPGGDPVFMPDDGVNYFLHDSDSTTLSALTLSNNIPPMAMGVTMHFTTASEAQPWEILLPCSYEDEETGQTVDPLTGVRINGEDKLICQPDTEYLLTIVAASENVNIFSLIELKQYNPTLD